MRLDVVFTPLELSGASVGERTVVVLDVLRATSTILEALVNGAQAVVPVDSVDAAVRKAEEIGRDHALLCGERDTQPIAGFALGNSPQDFTAARVSGKTLIMTTTNGTRALVLGGTAARCVVGSFLNLTAVSSAIGGDDTLIVCAGREGRFALEDALCAGAIVRRVMRDEDSARPRLNDAARTAMLLARRYEQNLVRVLLRCAAGRRLRETGRARDVRYCARADRHARVPIVRERRVTL